MMKLFASLAFTALALGAYAGTISGLTASLVLVDPSYQGGSIVVSQGTEAVVTATAETYACHGGSNILTHEAAASTDVEAILEVFWTKSGPNDPVPE